MKLEEIHDPGILRQLDEQQLAGLAPQLRELIIETVSRNGGHLASNLGTVELTLALLHNFDFTRDQVVWDVGHQSYSYKILTGRGRDFATLRKENGISGFPKVDESPYDAFDTGHSSTSISAALGISRGMKMQGRPGRCIAVIGDGALTGGMSYEALNNIDQDEDDLIIILNDNQMSIDRNVGSLARHLDQVRVSPRYLKLKSRVRDWLNRAPRTNRPITAFLTWLKRKMRSLTEETNGYFESLGFKCYGPIDGHNLNDLNRYLTAARYYKRPVILHVLTNKGQGYEPAEDKPELYHGVSAFDVDTGVSQKQPGPVNPNDVMAGCKTFTEAFTNSLMTLARQDDSIVAITAAMSTGTGLEPFAERWPERFYDVGIAEQHAVTLASGLARSGVKPVVAIYSTFLQRALDQVIHDAALMRNHVVFCIDRAGIVGADGETHQGLYDLAFLNQIPGMTILEPRDYRSLYDMLSFALYQCKGPVAIRYPRGGVDTRFRPIAGYSNLRPPLPNAELLHAGNEVTIAAAGSMVLPSLAAAIRLEEEGISCEVIDVRAVKPIDETLIMRSALSTGRLLTVEESSRYGGLGMTLSALISTRDEYREIRQRILAVGDHFVPQAEASASLRREQLDVDGICSAIREWVPAAVSSLK